MAPLEKMVRCVVLEGVAPQAAAGFAVRTCAGERGARDRRGEGEWRVETFGDEIVFDLASVTKPMTAVAVARACHERRLDRRASLDTILPELGATESAKVPLELFLAHRAGLEAHMPLFEPVPTDGRALGGAWLDRDRALELAANARRPDTRGAPTPTGGFAPVYSDMSYMLAGAALARSVGARDVGDAITELAIAPLALENAIGTARQLESRGVDLASRAAPTEIVAWRGGAVRGRVHDENAWALTADGGSGHAGMFGTVRGVLDFGCAVLDQLDGTRAPFGDVDLGWLVEERAGGTLRAGFDGKSDEGSSAGTRMGARAFGHLGFTGTSLWIDPDAKIVVSLLTNRVHPSRDNIAIRAARPKLHDALYELADARAEK